MSLVRSCDCCFSESVIRAVNTYDLSEALSLVVASNNRYCSTPFACHVDRATDIVSIVESVIIDLSVSRSVVGHCLADAVFIPTPLCQGLALLRH